MSHLIIAGTKISDDGVATRDQLISLTEGYASINYTAKNTRGLPHDFLIPGVGVLISQSGGSGKSTFINTLDGIIIRHGERDVSDFDNYNKKKTILAKTAIAMVYSLFSELKKGTPLVILDSLMRYMTGGGALSSGGFNYDLGFMFADLGSALRDKNQTVIIVLNARRSDGNTNDEIYERVVADAAANSNFVIRMDDQNTAGVKFAHSDPFSNGSNRLTRPHEYKIDLERLSIMTSPALQRSESAITADINVKRKKVMRIVDNPGDILKR